MQGHYRELAFSKIYSNKESIRKIDKAIVDINSHLKVAHSAYESKWKNLIKIQRDDKVIENVIRQFVESNLKTLGVLAVPTKIIDDEIVRRVDGVKLDIEVIELINKYKLFMTQEEHTIVLNSVKGIYQGMRSLTLNYGQVTDYGLEILAEALKFNKTISKVDLTSNKFTDNGLMALTACIRDHHTSISSLKLGFNKLKDKSMEYLFEALRDNRCLRELNLENNMLSSDSAQYLGLLIAENKDITHIYLEGNQIDDEACEKIAMGIRCNSTL